MRSYKDGERRTHKRIDIRYDSKGEAQPGYFKYYHWYIDTISVVQIGLNPPGKTRTERGRRYFETIADAKRYIDEF